MTGVTSEPRVVVLDDASELAAEVAQQSVAVLADAIGDRGVAHLVVTGGSILESVLAALATASASVDWSKVHVWWGDERYVPADSEDRNDLPALAKLFAAVDARLHRMPAFDAGFATVEDAADAYAAELADAAAGSGEGVPAFDVVLLGLGPDGHCASLFPGHPGTLVLDRSIIAVHDSPKPPPIRLSFTFPALDASRRIWFIASGEGKAQAVSRALGGAERTEVPSAGPRGREATVWYLDQDAAAELGDEVVSG